MFVRSLKVLGGLLSAVIAVTAVSCGTNDPKEPATVMIKNNFNDTNEARRPPWTICKCSYRGVEFGKILLGDTSAAHEVEAGLDYVLMVAAWDDTACSTSNCLPIASKIEEEVVEGQTRTISIQASNHQGPCPPTGIEPIPENPYNRILALWPEYNFEPYATRTLNPQCQ